MLLKLPTFALLLFFVSFAFAGVINDREITINSVPDVSVKRQSIIGFTWGRAGFPHRNLPDLPVIINDKSPIPGLPGQTRVDTLIVSMEHGLKSYAHHFIPKSPNHHLVVVHHGHALTFNDDDDQHDVGFGMRRTIEALLKDGYSVLAVYMPRNVHFETTIKVFDDGGTTAHNEFFEDRKWQPSSGSPMQYFLEPVAAFLNYLESYSRVDSFPEYEHFSMIGFSGGGWTAAVYSAIDTRIGTSIEIGGSLPLYARGDMSIGDHEQFLPNFYLIAGYPDIYLLASYGTGRRHIKILNRRDNCCFGEAQHDPPRVGEMGWDETIREYEARIRLRMIELGDNDLFRIEIDEASTGHMVSWDAIYDTVLPELNQARRPVATGIGTYAFARNQTGGVMQNIYDSWTNIKGSSLTGVPAVLRGAVSITDIFYRTGSNRLVHRAHQPFVWSRERAIAEDILSDPAAVSSLPGQWDVIAQRRNYYLYHFSQGLNGSSETLVSSIRSLGAPSAVSNGNGDIAVFYRGWDRALYCARRSGDGPWTVEFVGGLMTSDPAGLILPDGTLRAYIRGLSGDLWQASETPKGWEWTSISGMTTSGPITGRPSATLIGGNVAIFARMPAGDLGLFTFAGDWQYTSTGNSVTGSPAAAPDGTFIRDHMGTLWKYADGNWQSLGGAFD
jgi:hypothetical protein